MENSTLIPIFEIIYGTIFNNSCQAIIAAENPLEAESMLEKKLKTNYLSIKQLIEIKETGYKCNKSGILYFD